ncbi:stimulated by retinoic acid gene 6 protein-like isoform X2 [Halichondria panicea]|uniref:stimulated by retinoic acid gene 6 protein-like isoform X2 n=1 Tax=Halichondria panicea TaxID=6063 RepID=UPI00312B7AD4
MLSGLPRLVQLFHTRSTPRFCQGKWIKCKSVRLWLPSIAAPVSFLVRPRHRFIYILLFGLMSTQALFVLSTLNIPNISNTYANLFYLILLVPAGIVLILSLLYYPLFACVETQVPLVGHIIGFLYSSAWFTQYVIGDIIRDYYPTLCSAESTVVVDVRLIVVTILTYLPIVLISFYIILWYLGQCIKDCIYCAPSMRNHEIHEDKDIEVTTGLSKHQIEHVRDLLKKRPQVLPPSTKFQFVLLKIKEELFPYNKDFRFPLAFSGALMAMILLLYQLSFLIASFGFIFVTDVSVDYIAHVQPLLQSAQAAANSTFVRETLRITLDVLNAGFIGVPVIVVLAPFVSLIVCGCLLFHMVASVSKQIRRFAREGFQKELPSPFSRVPSSWKYIGYQIGFFVFAWIIYALLFILAGIAVIIVFIFLTDLTEPTVVVLLYLLLPLLWTKVFLVLQSLICYCVFFADKKGKFIAIKNRGLFNWFSYLLFFYNGFAGFMGAVIRTLMASLFGLVLLFRLDTVVLMRGFETFDYGHNSFLGFLYLDYVYNNAIIHVFFNILLNPAAYKQPNHRNSSLVKQYGIKAGDDTAVITGNQTLKSRRIHNRWLLAYSLLNNPSLQELRWHAIQDKKRGSPTSLLVRTSSPIENELEPSESVAVDVRLSGEHGSIQLRDGAAEQASNEIELAEISVDIKSAAV